MFGACLNKFGVSLEWVLSKFGGSKLISKYFYVLVLVVSYVSLASIVSLVNLEKVWRKLGVSLE